MKDIADKSPRIPNLFLIGAPKSGTTALSRYLAECPNIFMSEQAGYKEPEFFSPDARYGENAITSWKEYLSLFEGAPADTTYLGEASVTYLESQLAVSRILQVSPEALFVVILRNPIEIAVRLHNEHIKLGIETAKDFEKAWSLQADRLKGMHIPKGRLDGHYLQYGKRAKLGEQIENLLETAPRNKVIIIFYEDLNNDPDAVGRKLLKQIGVERSEATPMFRVLNKSVKYKSITLQRILLKLGLLRRKLGLPKSRLIRRIFDAFNTKPPDTYLDAVMHEKLVEYFREDIKKLEKLVGRDLSRWME